MSTRGSKNSRDDTRLREHHDCETLTELVYEYVSKEPGLGHLKNYTKGAFIWGVKSREHSIFFLKRGQVAILLNDAEGCEVIIRVVKSGELFGELCFCSKRTEPRQNCAKAVIDSESLEIHYVDFLNYLRRKPDALETFTFSLCKRLADTEYRIEVLSHRGAEARLGRLLLQLTKSLGVVEKPGSRVKLTVGHDDLARMAAMTRPHVSVTMGKLRGLELLNYDRSRQLTINVHRLADYLERSTSSSRKKQ